MTNRHVEDRLSAYLANELDPQERDFIESHIEICAACRRELEFLREVDSLLDDLPLEDPGPEFTEAVMVKARNESSVPVFPEPAPVRTRAAGFWKGPDFRNMVASVVAAFVLFQGFVGVMPKVNKIDSAIASYTAVTMAKLQIWVETVTRSFDR